MTIPAHRRTPPTLDRYAIAARAARDLLPGMIVNLGYGIPTLVSLFVSPNSGVILHSENGLLGYGPPITDPDRADAYCINAGGQPVELNPGASFIAHHEPFEIIRGGWIDLSILGALQVDPKGDLANYHVAGKPAGSVGDAPDLAFCAKHLTVVMPHADHSGNPKLVTDITLPPTAPHCEKRIVTDIAVIDLEDGHAIVREIHDAWTIEDLQSTTSVQLQADSDTTHLTL